ncbi:hypothetical protein NN561_014331 [Cricetulus griseus]
MPPPHWPRVGDAKCFGPKVTCFLCCEQWQRLVAPGDAGVADTAGSPLVPLPACAAERYRGGRSRQPASAVLTTSTCGRETRPPAARSPARPRAWGPGGDKPRGCNALRAEASGVLRSRIWRFHGGEGDRGCCRRALTGSGCWGHNRSTCGCETC